MDVNYEKDDEDYLKVVKWLMKVLNVVKEKYLKSDVVLNVNILDLNDNDIKGIKVCKIGKVIYNNEYVFVESNDEDKLYKLKGIRNNIEEDEIDLYYLFKGYVILILFYFDFINFSILEDVKKIFE